MDLVHKLFVLTQVQAAGQPDIVLVLNRLHLDIYPAAPPTPTDLLFDLNHPTFAACAKQAPRATVLLELAPLLGVYQLQSQTKYNSFALWVTTCQSLSTFVPWLPVT